MKSLYENWFLLSASLALALPLTLTGCAGPERAGDDALAEGDYSAAIGFFSEADRQSPDDPEVQYKLGLAYFRMGEEQAADPSLGGNPGSAFYDAALFFEKALELDPGMDEARMMLANAQYMNGASDEARESIGIYLQSQPDDGEALILAGRIHLALASSSGPEEQAALIDESMAFLEKALMSDTSLGPAFLLLGDGHLQKGEIGSALTTYQEGIRACPESNDLHGRLFYLKGAEDGITPKEAVAFYESLLDEKDPSRSPAGEATLWWFLGTWSAEKGTVHYSLEEYDLARGRYQKHLECLDRCVEICPDFMDSVEATRVTALLNRSWSYLKLERFDEAEKDMFETLDILSGRGEDPGENRAVVFAIDSLGFAVSQKDGMDGGLGFFRRLTSRWDRRHQWWNDYGFFSLETNMAAQAPREKFEETYQIYEKALELKPDYPRYLNDKGMLLLYYLDPEGKRREETEELFKKAWQSGKEAYESPFTDDKEKAVLFSSYTDALVNLARLQLLQGRADECRTLIDELLKDAPDRPETAEIRASYEKFIKEGTPYRLMR